MIALGLKSNSINIENYEIILFRDCLEDKFSIDEIFYFLYARNFIFQGPLCESSFSSRFTPLINFELIESCFEKLFIGSHCEDEKLNLKRRFHFYALGLKEKNKEVDGFKV